MKAMSNMPVVNEGVWDGSFTGDDDAMKCTLGVNVTAAAAAAAAASAGDDNGVGDEKRIRYQYDVSPIMSTYLLGWLVSHVITLCNIFMLALLSPFYDHHFNDYSILMQPTHTGGSASSITSVTP
jgi:hypothetical protein